ncbi:MAG: hypothetical protein M3273_01100 [Actinomycetota bacterium]|nr:hypothetical protein [Actinomycetota bacterium]
MRLSRCLLAALAILLVVPAARAGSGRSLAAGDALFWTGPHVEASSETWTYRFDVSETGYRLRVGLDHPEVDDDYSLQVTTPGGTRQSVSTGGGLYSGEVLIENPPKGTYRVEVRASSVTDSNFRVRAKLEARAPSLGTKRGPVLPNLQVLPPHEATFLMPVTNGATGEPPTGVDLAGAESCHPEEHAEDRAVRCLRFAFGVRNTGRGPMQVFYAGGPAGPDTPLYQRIQHADGTHHDREAGTARYHKTHGHYHHDAAIGLQLFAVVDPERGELEPAGEKRTKGFAHREELLREWDTFYPTWPDFGFGLDAGWADIYEWDRPGNYIDFGLNGDGRYVIRMWADPVEGIVESNERDNAGYTYLEVTGDEVRILETGRGRDPWDPCKIEVGQGGHADPPRGPRPRRCPPDTV